MKPTAQIQLFSHVSFLDKLLFTKHLSIMIKSGITIVEAFDIISSETTSQTFKKILDSIGADIKNGKSLSDSLGKHPEIFDKFYTSIVSIGETSGTLDESLLYLSQQLSKDYLFRKKIQGALIYPTIIFVVASVVGAGVALFVLPKLLDLFKDFDVQLPFTTQVLIFIAEAMKNYGVLIISAFVILCIGFRYALTLESVKPYWHRFILSVPIFGKIIRNAELTSLCRNLGIMLKSGLTVTSALDVEEKITTNIVFKRYVANILKAIDKGKAFSSELESGAYPFIPLVAAKMIAVGEKTGKLEETFLYLGDFFEDEVDDATRNIATIIEPIMLLVIGSIVAFMALAIISPIYELTSSIKR